jgi:hypothetical protein
MEGCGVGEDRKVAQTMYIHLSKCKNDKIKEREKEKQNNQNKKRLGGQTLNF